MGRKTHKLVSSYEWAKEKLCMLISSKAQIMGYSNSWGKKLYQNNLQIPQSPQQYLQGCPQRQDPISLRDQSVSGIFSQIDGHKLMEEYHIVYDWKRITKNTLKYKPNLR